MTSISSILLRSESETLDFKRDCYRFAGASDEEKAELLKDILAMANAWKDADGHIVVGVLEENGRAKDLVGSEPTLTDHDVHQFVNSKTNRPVSFGIENISYDGKSLTVIRISKAQVRPIYLKKRFGGLQPNVVYIRHGSSTAAASPDEIKEMGKDDVPPPSSPDISLDFEVELATWYYEKAFGLGASEKKSEEVDLLRVIAVNNGNALAQFIQGKITLPRGFLRDYIDRKNLTESVRDPARTKLITLPFSNQLSEPTANIYMKANPLEWKPLSPGMKLCLLKERIFSYRQGLKELDGSIRWELAVDSCSLKTGEQKIGAISIIDRRS
jgi:hypothetical protein